MKVIDTSEGFLYQIRKAKAPRTALRGDPILEGDRYVIFWSKERDDQGKFILMGNINTSSSFRCDQCGTRVFAEGKRFCCDPCGERHLELANRGFETSMFDAGLPVHVM